GHPRASPPPGTGHRPHRRPPPRRPPPGLPQREPAVDADGRERLRVGRLPGSRTDPGVRADGVGCSLGVMAVDVAEICAAFGLGVPTAPPSYVARGELGRVSRLATTTGVWALKELELFVPSVDAADANVDLQESMLAAGV